MGLLCRVHSLDEIEYLNFAVSHIHTTAAEIEVVLHVEWGRPSVIRKTNVHENYSDHLGFQSHAHKKIRSFFCACQ